MEKNKISSNFSKLIKIKCELRLEELGPRHPLTSFFFLYLFLMSLS